MECEIVSFFGNNPLFEDIVSKFLNTNTIYQKFNLNDRLKKTIINGKYAKLFTKHFWPNSSVDILIENDAVEIFAECLKSNSFIEEIARESRGVQILNKPKILQTVLDNMDSVPENLLHFDHRNFHLIIDRLHVGNEFLDKSFKFVFDRYIWAECKLPLWKVLATMTPNPYETYKMIKHEIFRNGNEYDARVTTEIENAYGCFRQLIKRKLSKILESSETCSYKN